MERQILNAEYRKAFNLYLRYGIPIESTLELITKAERTTTYYIWRTRGDEQVRTSHALNNGKIFEWDNPPETGHPAEDYGCRCVAEPYYAEIEPRRLNNLRERILAYLWGLTYWGDLEMSLYFFVGNGNGVTLNEIGHLIDIINFYEENHVIRFYQQLIKKSIATNSIFVVDDFNASYDFYDVLFSHGKSNIQGNFAGDVIINNDGTATIIGQAHFDFIDEFKDPISIAQIVVFVRSYFDFLEDIPEKDLNKTFLTLVNIAQRPYPISDSWSNSVNITIKIQ